VGLLRMARASRRLAAVTAAALALSAVGWIVVHRLVYGGWTAYAAGDHFQSRGEFSAVGFDPDLLGRSTRWVALFVDQGYGLVAWQPAWLLVVPAVGLLWGLSGRVSPARATTRRPGLPGLPWRTISANPLAVLALPLGAGLVTAVYIALTMHGFWWPGRQVVVVLPLAAMLIALALSHPALPHRRRWATGAGALAAAGVAIHAWVLTTGLAGDLTWVGAPDLAPPPTLAALRSALPDYRAAGPLTWWGHALWALTLLAMLLGARHAGARLSRAEGDGR
ncbi:MAG TPA: hypothetical protein VJ976_11425, partial [Ornithinimicrobium sp.]